MALRYEIEATGLNEEPHRVEIYDEDFTGGVTQVQANQQFLKIEGGTDTHVGLDPIWGKEARFNVLTDKDLSPLFGLRDRQAEVRIFNTQRGVEVFRGYLLSDFYSDRPFEALPGIELRASDGLTLLEDEPANLALGVDNSTSSYAYSNGIATILGSLYEQGLQTSIAANWYPDGPSSLTDTENPLEYTRFIPKNFREERNRGGQGAWLNAKSVLQDLCKIHALVIRQAVVEGQLQWTAWQWPELSDTLSDTLLNNHPAPVAAFQIAGQPTTLLTTWRYSPDGIPLTTDGTPQAGTSADAVNVPIGEEISERFTSPRREFERRTQSLSVAHDHADIKNLVEESGFESFFDGATFSTSAWDYDDSLDVQAEVVSHDDPDNTPDATQDNQVLLRLFGEGTEAAFPQDEWAFPVSQTVETINGPQQGATGRLKQSFEGNETRGMSNTEFLPNGIGIRFSVGDYYLKNAFSYVAQDVQKGKGNLYIEQPLTRPVPEGAKLRYGNIEHDPGQRPDITTVERANIKGYITLTEPAAAGSTRLTGDITDDQSIGGGIRSLVLSYPAMVEDTTPDPPIFYVQNLVREPRQYPTLEVLFAFVDENGAPLAGEITYEIGGLELTFRRGNPTTPDPDDFIFGSDGVFIDDISFSIERDGEPISKTTRIASVDPAGQSRGITVRTASGPTDQNVSRIKGLTPAGVSFRAIDWGRGAGGGTMSLAGLSAQEQLDYLQGHRERLSLTAYARAGAPLPIYGPELVTFDGKTYRIASYSERPSDGAIDLTLIEHKAGE